MCPTPLGRIHTRVATIVGPALLGVLLSALTGRADWIILIGVYLLVGVALDSLVYRFAFKYQPPLMTAAIAVFEFLLVLGLAFALQLEIPPGGAIAFFWIAWLIAVATKIAVLPIVSLTYLESAGEFRRNEWSVPPSQAPLPLVAALSPSELAPGPITGGTAAPRAEAAPSRSGEAPQAPESAPVAMSAPAGPGPPAGGERSSGNEVAPDAPPGASPEEARQAVAQTGVFGKPNSPSATRRTAYSAARRFEATFICCAVVLLTAVAVVAWLATR